MALLIILIKSKLLIESRAIFFSLNSGSWLPATRVLLSKVLYSLYNFAIFITSPKTFEHFWLEVIKLKSILYLSRSSLSSRLNPTVQELGSIRPNLPFVLDDQKDRFSMNFITFLELTRA